MHGKNFFISLSILILFLISSHVSAGGKEPETENITIEKFHAHSEANRLINENLYKLNLIEVICKNFGYSDYVKQEKDYWSARILVSQKDIIGAQKLLQKNKAEMNESLKKFSIVYQEATQEMVDECIDRINEFEFSALENKLDNRKKLNMLRDKITFAHQLFDNANEAVICGRYVSSISLFRSVKSYAISILKDLCEPGQENQIMDRFRIHIVDNRNEIYNKG